MLATPSQPESMETQTHCLQRHFQRRVLAWVCVAWLCTLNSFICGFDQIKDQEKQLVFPGNLKSEVGVCKLLQAPFRVKCRADAHTPHLCEE